MVIFQVMSDLRDIDVLEISRREELTSYLFHLPLDIVINVGSIKVEKDFFFVSNDCSSKGVEALC